MSSAGHKMRDFTLISLLLASLRRTMTMQNLSSEGLALQVPRWSLGS